jgi:hypothetical protein
MGLLALTGAAVAQSRSSFLEVQNLTGITVTENNPLSYTVTVGSDPGYTLNGQSFEIQDVFGFWALSDDQDLAVTTHDLLNWRDHVNNSGTGGIAGWFTPPPQGLTYGESFTFTFDSLSASLVDRFGFHVRLEGTNGQTLHITGGGGGGNVVPGPAAVVPFLLGGISALRRRRR